MRGRPRKQVDLDAYRAIRAHGGKRYTWPEIEATLGASRRTIKRAVAAWAKFVGGTFSTDRQRKNTPDVAPERTGR